MAGNFERKRRIVKTDDFSSVFRLRPVFKTDHLVLYARPNSLSHARLGVVVAKRLAPRAVTRNTIKRAVREGFRQSGIANSTGLSIGLSTGLDCVVRLSKPIVSKRQPACTAAIQAILHREAVNLFALSSKWKKVPEMARANANANADANVSANENAKGEAD